MAQLEPALSWIPSRGPLYEYVMWAAETSHAPAHFHIQSVLPVAAYLAAWYGYSWGDSWSVQEPFRVMTGIVCGSGVGKSTAIGGAQDFTEAVLARVGPRTPVPFIKASGSVQGLRLAMKEHKNDYLGTTPCVLVNDEVTTLLRQDDFADTVNRWFDGRSDEHHTVWMRKEYGKQAKEESRVERPALSGLFASTPVAMQATVRSEQIGGGLFSRILWAYGQLRPEELQLRRSNAEKARDKLVLFWNHWCTYLSGILPTDVRGCLAVSMTPEAFDLLEKRLFNKYRVDIANPHNNLSGIKMRLIEYAKQIGALYVLSDPRRYIWNGRLYITGAAIEPAINYIEHQCEASVEYLEQLLAPNPTRRLAAQIADALLNEGARGLTRTDIYRMFKVSKGELQAALETLEDGGEVVMQLTSGGPSGGRPSQRLVHGNYAVLPGDSGASASSRLSLVHGSGGSG